jgi:hypothetical protein
VFALEATLCPGCQQIGLQQIAVSHDARVLCAMLGALERASAPPSS